jgi:hypothetical protein
MEDRLSCDDGFEPAEPESYTVWTGTQLIYGTSQESRKLGADEFRAAGQTYRYTKLSSQRTHIEVCVKQHTGTD